MTPEQARERVERIRESAGDDEAAHGREDKLRHEILEAIASGSKYSRALAEIALTTSNIEFARWCA